MPIPVTALTALGLSAEDAAAIAATPEDGQATFDAAPYVEKVKANYQTQFQNDASFFNDITLEKLPPEIKKKVESAQFGRAANITTSKLLKGLGMTEADYADLPDEQKNKLEELIPVIVERYTKTKAGDKQLQADLIEARKKLEAFDGFEEKTKTKYETESNQKIGSAIFNAALIGELSAIPNLKISAGDIAKTANDIIQSKYSFERVGDYAIELRQKANPAMKVLKNGSSQELTLKEALIEIATERGWIDKQEPVKTGGGKITITPGKDGQLKMVAPHIQSKISSKIAAEA